MNSRLLKTDQIKNKLDLISLVSFLLSMLFLPLNMWLNNFFIVMFICLQIVSFFKFNFNKKIQYFKKNLKLLIIVTLPFSLALIGTTYSKNINEALSDVMRLLPILMIPILILTNKSLNRNLFMRTGYTLLFGCLLAALISWGVNVIELLRENKSLSNFLTPEYANQGLTRFLDIHASYMAILVNTCIAFIVNTINNTKLHLEKIFLRFALIILVVFLFHLLARTAIVVFIVSALIYIILIGKWKLLSIWVLVIIALASLTYSINQNYLRDRLINNLNIFESDTQFSKRDDRFERLKTSYEVFLQHPYIGPGTADEDELRREIFKKNRDVVAYNKNLNSHNQFFEYLSTYGILGAIIFIFFFATIFSIIIREKNYFFLFIFTALLLGSMTESLFERSLGIIYLSIYVALLISTKIKDEKN